MSWGHVYLKVMILFVKWRLSFVVCENLCNCKGRSYNEWNFQKALEKRSNKFFETYKTLVEENWNFFSLEGRRKSSIRLGSLSTLAPGLNHCNQAKSFRHWQLPIDRTAHRPQPAWNISKNRLIMSKWNRVAYWFKNFCSKDDVLDKSIKTPDLYFSETNETRSSSSAPHSPGEFTIWLNKELWFHI